MIAKQIEPPEAMLRKVPLSGTHLISDPDPLAGKVVKRCEFNEYDCYRLERIVFEDGTALELAITNYGDGLKATIVEESDA